MTTRMRESRRVQQHHMRLTVIIEQQNVKLTPAIPFKSSVWLTKEPSSMNKSPGLIQKVHVLGDKSRIAQNMGMEGKLTTASPGLNTRFEWYFHNSTFCLAVMTPGSESLPRDLTTSMTWGIVSLSSWSVGEADIIPFNNSSYRSRRGIGR